VRAAIVLDLGFGDAGKGLLTDWLMRRRGAGLVVRFNGGVREGEALAARGVAEPFSRSAVSEEARVITPRHHPGGPGPAARRAGRDRSGPAGAADRSPEDGRAGLYALCSHGRGGA
jgi:hypothetical protein